MLEILNKCQLTSCMVDGVLVIVFKGVLTLGTVSILRAWGLAKIKATRARIAVVDAREAGCSLAADDWMLLTEDGRAREVMEVPIAYLVHPAILAASELHAAIGSLLGLDRAAFTNLAELRHWLSSFPPESRLPQANPERAPGGLPGLVEQSFCKS